MRCPNCNSESGTYEEWWNSYLDGEGWEQPCLISYWDCHVCQTRVQHYDEEFIGEDE